MLKLILAERPELEKEVTCDMTSLLEILKRALERAAGGGMNMTVVFPQE